MILYHHRTQGKGVEGVHIHGIVKGLRERGHHVELFSLAGTDPFESRTSEKGRRGIKPFWRTISKNCPEIIFEILEIFYNLYSFFNMNRLLKKSSFDVIYERYALFGFSSLILSRKYGIPIVLEVNDAALLERTRPLYLRRIARALEGMIFRNTDHLLTISEVFKDYIKRYNVESDKITVIPNAADPEVFKETGEGLSIKEKYGLSGKTVVGFIGLFIRWHQIEFLLSIFEQVDYIDLNLHLLLIGDGPERTNIEKIIKERGLKDYVTLTGNVPHHEMPAFLEAIDIAVMANSNEYGSPMKIFEYMAMGKAIIAPAYPPIAEVIQDGINGILFTPNGSEAFRKAINTLGRDARLRRRLGTAAHRTFKEKHTWSKNSKKVEQICLALQKKI